MKVAYMPPIVDIGPYRQHIQFVLSVTNQQGRTTTGICFNITVLPVDNQRPEVHVKQLMVDEGGECLVSEDHLRLTDQDSLEDSLYVKLKRRPQRGNIYLDGTSMSPGQTFTMTDVKSLKVRYHHDNSETEQDDIQFIATDGINSADFMLHVKVTLVNDEVPVLVSGLKPVLVCTEGQEVIITIEYICATDPDSDDSTLMYMIARQPYYGVVQRNSIIVDRFSQADVTAGVISYRHTGQEIGLQPGHDVITFVISDGESVHSCCDGRRQTSHLQDSLLLYDLNITVYPVDNQPPSISIGEVFTVDEGGSASVTVTHLRAEDQDTHPEDLELIVITPPQFGYIENILPSPGFEKSNMGISIASFTYRDVLNGHINYVQFKHQRMEPTTDQIMLCVSDGKQQSSSVPFYIIIHPTNDEIPDFMARNITVREGDVTALDASVINAVDLDIPRERLMFSVIQQPRHGSITSVPHGNNVMFHKNKRGSEIPIAHFTMDDLRNGMTLMYMHDDSESEQDSFIIQLSDGKHKLQRNIQVKVLPVNDEEPQIIRNTGIEIEAGESRLLSSVVLNAHDKDTPTCDIIYVFETVPNHGVIQIKVGTDWLDLSAGMNCSQDVLDMNLLRYHHTGQPGAQTSDFFVFYLFDGMNRSPAQHFHITVKEIEKGDIVLLVKPVKSSRGERVILSTDVLLAVDGTDKPEELLYIITVPPAHGHVEYIKHTGVQIQSFSQLDVAANLLCYVHDNTADSPKETIQFVVSNGKSTRNGTLEIMVELTDKILPTLVVNTGLQVPQGSIITLSPDVLLLSDPDTPPTALIYTLILPPQYGQLLLKGQSMITGSKFTQKNIQDLDVSYRHSGGASQIDRFRFTASDSTERGFLLDGKVQTEPPFFTLQIETLDSSAPQIIMLQTLWKAELLKDGRYGIFISSRELKAQDTNSADDRIIYHILRAPYIGYIENSTNGDFVRQRFSQRDLNRRNIIYIINSAVDALTDSLEFSVSDVVGNTGPSHILEFSWASVELSRTDYVICESQRSVSLNIQRRGNVQDSSFVTVQVKELTASAGKDFLPASSSLIQFDPGVSSRVWRMEIVQDSLEEADEKLEVDLAFPVGTVLRGNTKATILIKDKNGQCSDTHFKVNTDLKGSEMQVGSYHQHGSIQVEVLPFSQGYIRGDGDVITPSATKKRLRVSGNGKVVQPSEIIRHGSDTIYRYHGIISMAVEDDNTASVMGRKAQVRVTSRGQQRSVPVTKAKLQTATRKISSKPASKPCNPELTGFLHYDESSGQLLRCNGDSWRPWTPTNETVKAQKCPVGWTYHNNRCYLLSTDHKATWSSAARACRETFNGNLVSILSKADLDWLWDFSERKPFWIGLNDRESKGRWEWVDGEPVTYTNWRRNPPKNQKKGTKKCVLVWRRTKWQIRDCKKGKGQHYMCYIKT